MPLSCPSHMSLVVESILTLFMCEIACMIDEIRILQVELDGVDGVVVTFSDGTSGGYVVEELLELRPVRERTETNDNSRSSF